MKNMDAIINADEADTIYSIVEEYFGTMKADTAFFELTHQPY